MSAIAEPAAPPPRVSPARLAAALGLTLLIAYALALFGTLQYAPAPLVSDGLRGLFRPGAPLRDLAEVALLSALPWALFLVGAFTALGRLAGRSLAAALADAAFALSPLAALPLTLFFDDPVGRQILAAALGGLALARAWPPLGLALARVPCPRKGLATRPHARAALALLGATAFLFYGAWARHHAQWSSLIDLGLFYEQFDNAQGKLLFAPTLGQSFLGEHFSPSLALLWPVLELFPSPVTLLALQSLALGLGAWFLYRLAFLRLGSTAFAQLIALAWLLSPYVQAAAFYDFHMDMLEPPMLFGLALALHRRRPLAVWLAALLLWTTKEDTFLYTSVLGLYAAAFLGQRKLGLALVAVGLAQAAVVLFAVLPALRAPFDPAFFSTTGPQEGYAFLSRYSHLGGSFSAIVGQVLGNPAYVLDHLTTDARLTQLLGLLLPFGGLALFAGWRLILLAPTLEMLLANPGPMSSFAFYYGAVASMFAPLAALEGARRLMDRPPRWLRAPVTAGPLFALIAGTTVPLLLWHPTSLLAGEHTYKPTRHTPHQARASALIDTLPPGARVSATGYQAVHLQPGRDVRMFPFGLAEAEHVLVDLQRPPWPRSYDQVQDELLRLPARGFSLVAADDGLFHLERRAPADPRAERERLRAALDRVVVEAELSEQTGFMSRVGGDDAASNGAYRRASPAARKGPDFLQYGPYARVSPGPYRATFRLRWRDRPLFVTPADRVVATVDVVTDQGRRDLARRELRPADFAPAADGWLDVRLDLTVPPGAAPLELRVFYPAVGTLDLDVSRLDPVESP